MLINNSISYGLYGTDMWIRAGPGSDFMQGRPITYSPLSDVFSSHDQGPRELSPRTLIKKKRPT